jgi:hypothetical protein
MRLLLILLTCLLCIGCGKRRYRHVALKQIESGPGFNAKVETIFVETNVTPTLVIIGLKTADGRQIALGEPQEGPQLLHFAGSLSKGKTYEFPKTWLEFREAEKKRANP